MYFQRLVVCLEESLFIHNIRDMKVRTKQNNSFFVVNTAKKYQVGIET